VALPALPPSPTVLQQLLSTSLAYALAPSADVVPIDPCISLAPSFPQRLLPARLQYCRSRCRPRPQRSMHLTWALASSADAIPQPSLSLCRRHGRDALEQGFNTPFSRSFSQFFFFVLFIFKLFSFQFDFFIFYSSLLFYSFICWFSILLLFLGSGGLIVSEEAECGRRARPTRPQPYVGSGGLVVSEEAECGRRARPTRPQQYVVCGFWGLVVGEVAECSRCTRPTHPQYQELYCSYWCAGCNRHPSAFPTGGTLSLILRVCTRG
jgi:hypothetical protein